MGLCEGLCEKARTVCPGLPDKTYVCAEYLSRFCKDDMFPSEFVLVLIQVQINIHAGKTYYGSELPKILSSNIAASSEAFLRVLEIVEKIDKAFYSEACKIYSCIDTCEENAPNGEVLLEASVAPEAIVVNNVFGDESNYLPSVNAALLWWIRIVGYENIKNVIKTFRYELAEKICKKKDIATSDVKAILRGLDERTNGRYNCSKAVIDEDIKMSFSNNSVRVWRGIGSLPETIWKK